LAEAHLHTTQRGPKKNGALFRQSVKTRVKTGFTLLLVDAWATMLEIYRGTPAKIFIPKQGTRGPENARRGTVAAVATALPSSTFWNSWLGSKLVTLCSRSTRKYSSRKLRFEER